MPPEASSIPTLPNNNWTQKKETQLREWQLHSRLRNVCHGRAQERYAQRNNGLLLPSIVMGALATFFDGAALLWEEQAFPFIMSALFITLISTILGGVLQATGPADEASKHESMAKGYNKIILEIDSMLTKDYAERENGSRFITKISEELIALKTGGVKVPSDIWKGVQKSFLDGSINFDLEEGKITADSCMIEMDDLHVADDDHDSLPMTPPAPPNSPSDPSDPNRPHDLLSLSASSENSSRNQMPRFELRVARDPVKRKQLETLYEIGQNRFT